MHKALILYVTVATSSVVMISGCKSADKRSESVKSRQPAATAALKERDENGVDLSSKKHRPETWTKQIEKEPQRPELYYFRGIAYGVHKDWKNAIVDFDKAIELDPKLAAAFFFRGNCYNALGKYDLAIVDYTEALTQIPKFQPENLNVISKVYNARATLYLKQKKYDWARRDLDAAIIKDSADQSSHLLRCCVNLESGKFHAAITDAQTAVSINPSWYALALLGKSYRQAKSLAQASKVLSHSVKPSAESLPYLQEKVQLYLETNRAQEGAAICGDIIRSNVTNDLNPYYVRGLCYRRSGEYLKAVQDFDRVIAEAPVGSFYANGALLERSQAFEVVGEVEKAESDLDSILAHSGQSDTRDVNRRLVNVLMAQNKPDKIAEAISRCTTLIEEKPDAFDYARRSSLFEHRKQYAEALADLKTAAKLDKLYTGNYLDLKARVDRVSN